MTIYQSIFSHLNIYFPQNLFKFNPLVYILNKEKFPANTKHNQNIRNANIRLKGLKYRIVMNNKRMYRTNKINKLPKHSYS